MKALGLVLALALGGNAMAQSTDGGTDAPLSIRVDEGSVVPHGTADTVQVGPGVYLNADAAVNLATKIEELQAQRDALAKAYDTDNTALEAKNNSPIIAAIIVGVVCLGGGIAIGMALK